MELNLRNMAVLGCRMLAIYFFVSAVVELTFLPDDVLTLLHYFSRGSVEVDMNPSELYLRRHYLLWCGSLVLRIVLYLVAAVFFFRPSPRALALLLWSTAKRETG